MVITPGGRGRCRKFPFTNSSVSCCVIRFDLSRSRYSPLGTNLLTPRKERPSMKTKSVLLRSVSVVLALLVFVALPSSTLAVCSPAHDVAFYVEYGPVPRCISSWKPIARPPQLSSIPRMGRLQRTLALSRVHPPPRFQTARDSRFHTARPSVSRRSPGGVALPTQASPKCANITPTCKNS